MYILQHKKFKFKCMDIQNKILKSRILIIIISYIAWLLGDERKNLGESANHS